MNTKSILSSLLFLLMVVAVLLSYSVEGVSPSATVSLDSSQQSSLCKGAQIVSPVKNQPAGVKQGEEDAAPSQGATTFSSSCNTSLQVIAVEKQNIEGPSESSLVFPPYTSAIPSQFFVFQEPDPPQTI